MSSFQVPAKHICKPVNSNRGSQNEQTSRQISDDQPSKSPQKVCEENDNVPQSTQPQLIESSLDTEGENRIIVQSYPDERDLVMFALSFADYSMEPDEITDSERRSILSSYATKAQGNTFLII